MAEIKLLIEFAFTFLLTFFIRYYALKRNVLDVPNSRSSHTVPTPRGGGLAIVIGVLAVLFTSEMWGLFVAGTMVALIGWLDDHGHIQAIIRLFVHFIAAIIVVIAFDGIAVFDVFDYKIELGWFGYILAILGVVWLLNLYNFMDGIDGIAGVEAVTTLVVAGLILLNVYGFYDAAWIHLYLAAAVFGFLVWNFPVARIFMGDVGSGFIGLVLAGLLLHGATLASDMLWVWLILLGVFIVDATYTLLMRVIRGGALTEAHCQHAYQKASKYYGTHKIVTFGVLLINLCWLSPIAYLVAINKLDGFFALILAYLPLLLVAKKFKAGDQ